MVQIQTNELKNMKWLVFFPNEHRFYLSGSGSSSSLQNIVANSKGELKSITTRSGLVLDGPTVLMPPPFINPEEDERVEKIIKQRPGTCELPLRNSRIFEASRARRSLSPDTSLCGGVKSPGHLAARLGCAETKVATWDDLAFKLIILGWNVKHRFLQNVDPCYVNIREALDFRNPKVPVRSPLLSLWRVDKSLVTLEGPERLDVPETESSLHGCDLGTPSKLIILGWNSEA
ncbi:hypothetical protein Tco_0204018 [Tanacetum coccineum]